MSSNNQEGNQELFGAGKVSWNGEHFDKRFMYDIQQKGQGRNIGVFSPKCILNKNLTHRCTLLQNQCTFFYF